MSSRRHKKLTVNSSNGPQTAQQLDPPTDCLSRCQYEPHANVLMRCASTGNLELLKHCVHSVCANPWSIRDSTGRTVLLVATSCGHLDIVLWLLKKKGRIRVDHTDGESRWGALHRAAYYGHAGVLFPLSKNGCNLEQMDYDKYTPLNILQYNMESVNRVDKLLSVSYLYVWGTNANMTLGHDHIRSTPEILDLPKEHGDVKQAVICKFHSVFLSEGGRVYTCGHGQGGRLGHGNDKTCLSPKLVQGLKNDNCVSIAAARNHTVFLADNGIVYTCGLNDAFQLGQTPKVPGPILPHSLSPFYLRSLKGSVCVKCVGAGRYHTAVCTDTEVYTCGRNMGQLGHGENIQTQIQPKLVTGVYIDKGDSISHFSVSDAATACITKKKRVIYVCANYRVLRCERLAVPESVSIVEFVLCASLGRLQNKQQKKKGQNGGTSLATPNESGLTIGLTDSNNQLWMSHWEDLTKKSHTSPQLVPGSTKRSVIHFTLTKNLTIVTPQGEVFTTPLSLPVVPSLLSLKRVPALQQAKRVFTDYKTNNMAVIQTVYSPPTLPRLEKSSFSEDIYGLLTEDQISGSVSDITFNVSGSLITANKLVLSSQSPVFSSLFKSLQKTSTLPKLVSSFDRQTSTITVTHENPQIFQLFLQYLYGGELIIKATNNPKTIKDPKPSDIDSSPSTTSNSKTSLDDSFDGLNSWNTLYDKFGYERQNSFDIFNDSNFIEESSTLTSTSIITQDDDISPSRQTAITNTASIAIPIATVLPGAVVAYESGNVREDMASLKTLAAGFRVDELMKRLDSVGSSPRTTNKSHSHVNRPHSYSIKGPQVPLVRESVPHDVVIISETEKEHYCHKCVLVSRSDYFQSMLLMGWRETTSEESETKLRLPMSDPLVEMVIEYLYTDRVAMVQDSSSLEWLVSALTIADQLLLKRLKTICELSLARILSLDNIEYIIGLSEVYNADQLQTSCVEFVCLNLPALLEMGGLEGVSTSILNRISQTYKEMFPEVSKRKGLKMRELSMDEVPQSYLSNEVIESTDDEIEDSSSWIPVATATNGTPISRAKSPVDTPSTGSKTTPTTNSAKRKRRKKGGGAKSENTSRQLFTPSTPQDNKKSSEPYQQSHNELEYLDKLMTEIAIKESTMECVDNQTEGSNGVVNGGGVMDASNEGNGSFGKRVLTDNRQNMVDREGKSSGLKKSNQQPWGIKKRSVSESGDDNVPIDLREIMSLEESRAEKQKSKPINIKLPKNALPNETTHIKTTPTRTPPTKTPPMKITVDKHSPLSSPVNDEVQQQQGIVRSMSLPVSNTIIRSPSSPWGMDVNHSSSTHNVSLRTLMAEQEAAETREVAQLKAKQQQQQKQQSNQGGRHFKTPDPTVKRDRRTSFPPPSMPANPIPPPPLSANASTVVSFSDIITHQQHELDCHLHNQSYKKQFQLIQIEEQAIQGLLTLYNALGNPNEYVTVERVSVGVVRSRSLPQSGPLNRRTSAPYTGTNTAWDRKL